MKVVASVASAMIAGSGVIPTPPVGGAVVRDWVYTADHALILGPTGIPDPDQAFINSAVNDYLAPLGYNGGISDALAFFTPEQDNSMSYTQGLADLTPAVEADWKAGDFSSANPLWIFSYSQSTVIVGDAESAWHADGIPTDALHIVMVGDTASAEGGFTNTVWSDFFDWFDYDAIKGAITPDNFYPTDVFTIPGDGWADAWGDPLNVLNLQHDEYLGLTPSEIQSVIAAGPTGITDPFTGVTAPATEGLTSYFQVDLSFWQEMDALWDAFWAGL